MSLVGNLEDLGLGEILQIVSLSRKSGILELNSRDRHGKVIFRAGQVIRATATTFPENLGDLLLRAGILDIDTLKRALIVQQERADGRRIGDILADGFGVDRTAIDTVVREHVERIVYSFFGWTEGAFAFELGEPEDLAALAMNPLQFMLDSGLNPQWLAMEGSRLIDEKRHRGEASDECGESRIDAEQLLAEVRCAPVTAVDQPSRPVTNDKQLYHIGVELYRELGEASGLTPQQTRQSPGLHLLRGMLQELTNPSLGGGIILLILRFASELMNRAVIFLVKDQEIVGLGQFGLDLSGESADAMVSGTRIPTGADSLFAEALTSMVPTKGAPSVQRWNSYLFDQFGGARPQEVFVGPLVSEGRVVAILYGDNLPEQKPIGDTEALEIFLSQAGLAMEKVLLERRLMDSRTAW